MLHVQLTPKSFLSRLKAVSALAGRRWPKPVLESVQFEANAGGRGVLRATNLEAFVAVEVPLLKNVEPGTIQLPIDKLPRLLAEARGAVIVLPQANVIQASALEGGESFAAGDAWKERARPRRRVGASLVGRARERRRNASAIATW